MITLSSHVDPEDSRREPAIGANAAGASEDDSLDRVLRRNRRPRRKERPSDPLTTPSDARAGTVPAPVETGGGETTSGAGAELPAHTPAADLQSRNDRVIPGSAPRPDAWPGAMFSDRPQPVLSGWDSFRLSPIYRMAGAAIWVVALLILWRAGSAFLEGEFMRAVLALEAPFLPVPAPDSTVVAEASLKSAALVGAPLVLAVLWFAGAYQIDRTARRTFGFVESVDSRYPAGYVITAILSVFPLLVFGVIGAAWGGVGLVTWAITHESWGSVIALLALLGAFSLGMWLLDTGFERRDYFRRPRAR